MRKIRIPYLFMLLTSLLWFGSSQHLNAQQPASLRPESRSSTELPATGSRPRNSAAYGARPAFEGSDSSGLREVIDSKYQKRYQEWKDEFLSTEIGRAQWELYTRSPHL